MTDLGVMVCGRQAGKTTETIRWVLEGEQVEGYPGWSRVLVVPNMAQFNFIRTAWWERIEDFDHRIYTAEDWTSARISSEVEVCLDNAEWLLPAMPGRVTLMTMTGVPWEPQTALSGSNTTEPGSDSPTAPARTPTRASDASTA